MFSQVYNPQNFIFMRCDRAGDCIEENIISTIDWNDFKLSVSSGNGILRTYTKKNIISIIDMSIGNEKDTKNRVKLYHPVMGYTYYPELCEKCAEFYMKWQKVLFEEEVRK